MGDKMYKDARRHSKAFRAQQTAARGRLALANPVYDTVKRIGELKRFRNADAPALPLADRRAGTPHNMAADRFLASDSISPSVRARVMNAFSKQGLDPAKFSFRGLVPADYELSRASTRPSYAVRRVDELERAGARKSLAAGGSLYAAYPGVPGRAYDMIPLPRQLSNGTTVLDSKRRGVGTTADVVLGDEYLQRGMNNRVMPTKDEPLRRTQRTFNAMKKFIPAASTYSELTAYNKPYRMARMLQNREQRLSAGGRVYPGTERRMEAVRQAPAGRTDDVASFIVRPTAMREDMSDHFPGPGMLFTARGRNPGVRFGKLPLSPVSRASSVNDNNLADDELASLEYMRARDLEQHIRQPAPLSPTLFGEKLAIIRDAARNRRYPDRPLNEGRLTNALFSDTPDLRVRQWARQLDKDELNRLMRAVINNQRIL